MADSRLWTPVSYDVPGENMPGSGNSPTPPEETNYRFTQSRFSAFAGKLGSAIGAGMKGTTERPTPPPQRRFDTQAALEKLHPSAPEAWEATKWAFRGKRTTETYSQAHQQNLYGGVQRDLIPTARIATWSAKNETGDQARLERRRDVLNEQDLYPPGHDSGDTGGAPQGLPPGTGVDPTTMPFDVEHPEGPFTSNDPLFNQNVRRGLNVNPLQFNPHQRATTGL
jgi:hypothetical protein